MTGEPKLGDNIDCALWFNSLNPKDRADAERGLKMTLDTIAAANGFTLAPMETEEIGPLDSRIADLPPEQYHGAPKVLYATAKIVKVSTLRAAVSAFTHELDRQDLERLRGMTKRVARQYGQTLSTREADDIINRTGPEAALASLEKTVH